MADIKITDLVAYTSPASTDVLPIVDVGADITKKVSIEDLFAGSDADINGLTVGRGAGNVVSNVVVGSLAFVSNTSGANNIAIGREALETNSTGSSNIAIGRDTGRLVTSDNNTLVGYRAGFNLASGSKNICIGYGSGAQVTTGSNNTIIGDIDGTAALADTVIIGAGTTERLRIDSSGNTGLGTTSPAKPLHVYQTASGAVARFETGGTDSTIQFRDTSTGGNFPQMGGAGNDLKFVTSASERVRVDSAGRVLIGLSSSSAEASLILEGSSAAGAGDAVLWINRGATPSTSTAGAELGKIKFGDIDQNVAVEIEGERDGGTWTSGVSHPGRLLFKTTADGAATPAERMRITSAGLFGIGTSGPVAKFDIRAANDPTVQENVLIIRATGTPSYAAAMGATSTGGAFIARGNASVQGEIQFATTDGSYASYLERMRIDASGRVGIGISSPDTNSKVDVDGRVQSSQDFVATTRGTNGGVADFILLTSSSGGSSIGARIRHDGSNDILSISNDPGTSTQHLLIRGNGVMNYALCPTYADDTAAGSGGLVAGDIYKTSTGELRIKL
jgi:hypothetical protein